MKVKKKKVKKRKVLLFYSDCCICMYEKLHIFELYIPYPKVYPKVIFAPKVICDSCKLSFCRRHAKIHSDSFCVFQAVNGIPGVLPKNWKTLKKIEAIK